MNYRYFHRQSHDDFDRLIAELRSGALDEVVPVHGVLQKVRQQLGADQIANITPPEDQVKPVWIARYEAEAAAAGDDPS